MTEVINVEDNIRKILAEQLGIAVESIKLTDDIKNDLGGDSLDIVEITMFVEDDFNVEFTNAECDGVTTVQSLIDLVNQKTA